MSENYRDMLYLARLTGEAVKLPYEAHCREALLEELRGRLLPGEWGYEEPYMREETEHEDLLWLLNREEVLEKGIYSWNRPTVDLAIVAPPALMALIMGEYELAVKLSERGGPPSWKNRVEELYQDRGRSGIGGGCYSFGEACLLSMDMPVSEKLFFWQKGYYDVENIFLEEPALWSELQLHRDGQKGEEDFWNIMKEIKTLGEIFEDTRELFVPAIEYALNVDMDWKCGQFWEKIYELFPSKEEHIVIVEVLHRYFVNLCSAESTSLQYEERVLAGVQAYFQYEDSLLMQEGVERYLLERITMVSYMQGCWRICLEQYLDVVKCFEGTIGKGWQQGMYELLKRGDEKWFHLGFKSGFLRKDCIKEYVDYLLQELSEKDKRYSLYISKLIQMMWREEEDCEAD